MEGKTELLSVMGSDLFGNVCGIVCLSQESINYFSVIFLLVFRSVVKHAHEVKCLQWIV